MGEINPLPYQAAKKQRVGVSDLSVLNSIKCKDDNIYLSLHPISTPILSKNEKI